MDQKMMKILGAIIAGFVVFIILLFFISSCTKTKYTYEKLEEDMMDVAKKYYKENEKELPALDKDFKTMTLKKMINDGKIDELAELFDDENIKCDGNVTITNNNGYYLYSPYLNCDDDYKSVYLKDKIIEDSLVEKDVGLYEEKNTYVMKGEVNNNYVSFNNQLFRIIRINEDGTVRLYQNTGEKRKIWDNRYNSDRGYNSGINNYEQNSLNSRLKDTVEEIYNNSNLWPDETKSYITNQDLCVGKRSQSDTSKDGSTECAVKIPDQPFSLLAVYEYLQASLDENCLSTIDNNCKNYNWIGSLQVNNWSITADADSSFYAYKIQNTVSTSTCSSQGTVSIVFNLTDKAIYTGGTGTETDPYTFK